MRIAAISASNYAHALSGMRATYAVSDSACHSENDCSSTELAGKNAPASRESDSIELSAEARQAADDADATPPEQKADRPGSSKASAAADTEQLTPEELEQVQELNDRDQEVRQHEAAHLAAAGPYASGGPSFTYQSGPDSRSYAIGGEVQIDVSPVDGDPEATIRKMQVVRAAALAPADPSSQDRAVAAMAGQQEARAIAELAKQNTGGNDESAEIAPSPNTTWQVSSRQQDSVGKSIDLVA